MVAKKINLLFKVLFLYPLVNKVKREDKYNSFPSLQSYDKRRRILINKEKDYPE